MSRLIKNSNIDLNIFLISQLNYGQHYEDEINLIIKDNSDCIYTGSVYRGLLFHPDEIRDAYDKFLSEINESKVDFKNFSYYLYGIMSKLIRINGLYQSFSKSFEGAYNVLQFRKEPIDINIIFKCDVENGLDIEKLVNKHKDNLSLETKESFNIFKNQEEVLAKFIDFNFYFVEFGDLKNLFIKFQKE